MLFVLIAAHTPTRPPAPHLQRLVPHARPQQQVHIVQDQTTIGRRDQTTARPNRTRPPAAVPPQPAQQPRAGGPVRRVEGHPQRQRDRERHLLRAAADPQVGVGGARPGAGRDEVVGGGGDQRRLAGAAGPGHQERGAVC